MNALRGAGHGWPTPGAARTLAEWFERTPPTPLCCTPRTVDVSHGNPSCRSAKAARVEAALLVADGSLTARKLVQFAMLLDVAEAKRIVEELNEAYDAAGTAFRIEWVASGFQLLTRSLYAPWLEKLHERRARVKLSPPSLETLVIVAYRQPVTRADVDSVRGVQSAELLRQLLERGLVRIVGEDDSLGRPYLYGTTKSFLETFGLRNLDELPRASELRRRPEKPAAASTDATDEPADDETEAAA